MTLIPSKCLERGSRLTKRSSATHFLTILQIPKQHLLDDFDFNIINFPVLDVAVSKGLYTWSDLHTCANFAYMQNLRTYANHSMCTHLLTYANFARMQKFENLHLPCIYMQIWSCERKAKFAPVSIYSIVLYKS